MISPWGMRGEVGSLIGRGGDRACRRACRLVAALADGDTSAGAAGPGTHAGSSATETERREDSVSRLGFVLWSASLFCDQCR
jgi:hypothetical protein